MRDILQLLMLLPPAVSLMSIAASAMQFKAFRRRVPHLCTPDDLRCFRRIAAIQMYLSLIVLPLGSVPLLLWLFGMFVAGVLGWADLWVYVALPSITVLIASRQVAPVARQVRATPADPALAAERDHVVDFWLHHNLPDW